MEAMPPLADAEIGAALDALPGWTREGDEIAKEYDCGSFPAAIAFVVRVGFLAEKADHHPDIDIRYSKVTLRWTTHSEGGITERDHDMARRSAELA